MRNTALLSLAILALAGAAAAQDARTRTFLTNAMKGDSSEVMLGKLAADQGGSDASKRYGQMLVDDHSKHLQDVQKLAKGLNLSQDVEPTAGAESELHKLARLQGGKFDREFAQYMIRDHRKDLSEYEKASRMSGDVGKLARDTLPTLHKHLSEAEKLKG